MRKRLSAILSVWVAAMATAAPLPPVEDDYNQWKQAFTNSAMAAEHITAPRGFKVELVRSAQTNEGSWVALAFDPRGRIVIAREDRGLLRLTPATDGTMRVETINTNLLECRGLLFAHKALYVNANNSKGLYRLRDVDGDDQFEEVTLLKATPGGVGHGRNQLALGPDGMIYSIHGDDVGLPAEGVAPNSPLRNYAEDSLLPCEWNKHLFNASAKMPYGHLVRTDAEGRRWELVAGGLRNPFGIDFNESGDLFTYDADMEWDVGMPWYHPTRVLHLVPGGDYGWRRGTGVLPVWSPDTLPSAVDVGLGSPTAVKFGTKSSFPEPWRSALFVQDWAYGKIYAVHLERAGASYTGRVELFLKGRPLNVTSLDFGPDGAMYFTTGGRKTQSGLYRVKWDGATARRSGDLKKPRRSTLDVWKRLDDPDQWVRHAARVELEMKPVAEWQERALRETRPMASLTALLALSRSGDASLQPAILNRLHEWASKDLTSQQQLVALRALAVCFIRMGRPDANQAQRFEAALELRYAGTDTRVNQAMCELLVYLESPDVVRKTIPLIAKASTQEEKLNYLFMLRLAKAGWTIEERRTYFDWLGRARREFRGARMLPTALNYIRADAEATLTPAEREALADTLAALDKAAAPPPPPPIQRQFVKQWSMAELAEDNTARGESRDLARGKRLFLETGCAQCHRVGSEGGVAGPDLTAVAGRFDRRALLESLLEPSKVVADAYRNLTITMKSGAIYDGRILTEDAKTLTLAANPVDMDDRRRISKADIVSRKVSDVSPMPEGLLNTLTREEIADLLAWLQTAADSGAR